jgi:hypothetical protein
MRERAVEKRRVRPDPAVRGYWKMSFPENESPVKGNFPAGAFMAVRGVVRTSWVWDSVIFLSGL